MRFLLTNANDFIYIFVMANKRLSKEKQVYVLAALCEGTPINAVCRMFKVGKHAVLRVIEETGEALGEYMNKEFRDLRCGRVEIDECWSYVFKHGREGQKMAVREEGKGDYWLWAAMDSDTKLCLSHRIGRRDYATCDAFIEDMASRVEGPAQYVTDSLTMYRPAMREYAEKDGSSYGTETKHYLNPENPEATPQRLRNRGTAFVKVTRDEVFGVPHLGTLTNSHVERLFLTVRQELARFGRLTLAYSKDIHYHTMAVALHIGLYNLCRRHKSLEGHTPAQAAGVELKRWSLDDVVALTESYWLPKYEAEAAQKAALKRLEEDAMFAEAIEEMEAGL